MDSLPLLKTTFKNSSKESDNHNLYSTLKSKKNTYSKDLKSNLNKKNLMKITKINLLKLSIKEMRLLISIAISADPILVSTFTNLTLIILLIPLKQTQIKFSKRELQLFRTTLHLMFYKVLKIRNSFSLMSVEETK